MGPTLSILGLVLDIVGVVVLGIGGVMRPAALIRQSRKTYDEIEPTWFQKIPVRLALRCGSPKSPSDLVAVEEIASNFWGLLLIALGFLFQGFGAVLSACGGKP